MNHSTELRTSDEQRQDHKTRNVSRDLLLVCGIISSLLYVGSDIVASMLYEGYRYTDQAFSELLAIGAPTRPLMIKLSVMYNLLVIAFTAGVWAAAGSKRSLRITAVLLFAFGVASFLGPFVPMHVRGSETTFTDVMHIICTIVIVLSVLLAMGFGAAAFGKGFRLYSIATILAVVIFGAWAGFQGPRLAAGLPTPWFGVLERVNIYSTMLWILVLSVNLLKAEKEP